MSDAVELLTRAVSSSNIRIVAIIDDSFDVPKVSDNDLITFLSKKENRAKCIFIDDAIWNGAIQELESGDGDANITDLVKTLHSKYIETGQNDFDPGSAFFASSDNLKVLRPTLELLKKFENIRVDTYGTNISSIPTADLPDLILIDLFLDSEISSSELPESTKGNRAINLSVSKVLKAIQKENDPAIVLMSSHGEKGLAEAQNYRNQLDGKVFASRFGFVDKNHISKDASDNLTIQDSARDTLIDIFQTNKFGKALAQALTRWTQSAEQAVAKLKKDIHKLELKEIAYLVQFRLDEEGQELQEYLEWFFGEALQDHIVHEVDSHHLALPLENSLDKSAVISIDGACEPTSSVAQMYHRVRFENKRSRSRKNFRLGDLYWNTVKNEVYAVMTPDCDLVLRTNGARGAAELLMVPGRIMDLEKVSASVGDFLIINGDAKNIIWDYKKAITRPFTECFSQAGQSDPTWTYLGTLRPLYAQEIQAHLLSHIGRVGVAVPPAIGMHAVASISVKTNRGYQTLTDLVSGPTFTCSLLLGRSRDKKPRVVFDRYEIKKIKEALMGLTADLLVDTSAPQLLNVMQTRAQNVENNLRKGLEIDKDIGHGIKLVETIPNAANGPWAVMLINQVEMPAPDVTQDNAQEVAPEANPATVGLIDTTAGAEADNDQQ